MGTSAHPQVWSSYGSTSLPLEDASVTFPIDKITEPTACTLYLQERFFKVIVASGQAYPCGKAGDVLDNPPLPVGYCKVAIDAIAKSRYHGIELDHPEDEDRKTLG